MRVLMLILPVVCALCGCSRTPDEIEAEIVADDSLTNQQAIERLAENIFKGLESHSTTVEQNGNVTLNVIVRSIDDAEFKTLDLQAGPSAAELDAGVVLGMTVFDGRRMIRYGRQRSLGKLVIAVLRPALDETGETVDVEIFKYAVPKDRFDKYLNTGSALEIAQGEARRIIHETSLVEYDYFDSLRYSESEQ